MNLVLVAEYLIGSVFLSIFFILSGKLFLKSKLPKNYNTVLMIIILMLFITFNYMLLDNIAKLVTLYVFVLFTYKVLFKKNFAQCAIASLISYLLLVICEVIFIIIITSLHKVNIIADVEALAGSAIANFFICDIAIIVSIFIHKIVNSIIIKFKENNKIGIFFTFICILIAIGSVLYKMDFGKWELNQSLILNILIILSFVYIGLIIIKQYFDKIRIGEDYEKYLEYSKQTEKLVEQYSISQHENKNELIIIKSMVHKNNTKLLDYLNEIITSKDNIENSWVKYLKYIPFGGLKGIVHNKISNMMENDIKVFLNISKEVGKSNLNYLTMKENVQLSKIIGVFLDNAKEASILSEKKEVSILAYMEGRKVVFEIFNSFRDDVDLEKIYKVGHSSKGKHRGYGLSLTKSIIEESNLFENKTEIKDDYFIQILKVNK